MEGLPSIRMIRAARALLDLDQTALAKLVGVDRRTIVRIETDKGQTDNPRRLDVLRAIRDSLEKDGGVRFIFADKTTGEGVVMKKGK
ncbi:DNA-binding XRE family transcriptional regulator [Nitrobacteraceae bacterium AZCC 2161]